MNAPQKPVPEHTILVSDKMNAYRNGPTWSPGLDRINPAEVAYDLAADGRFDTIDGRLLLSDTAFDDWLAANAYRFQ